jgi:hypothetical protein
VLATLASRDFLLGLHLYPEDGGDIAFVGKLLMGCTEFQQKHIVFYNFKEKFLVP